MLLGVPKRGFGSHPCRVVSSSYQKMVHCHGRGREFESRRPRHFFPKDLSRFLRNQRSPERARFRALSFLFSSVLFSPCVVLTLQRHLIQTGGVANLSRTNEAATLQAPLCDSLTPNFRVACDPPAPQFGAEASSYMGGRTRGGCCRE